MQRNRPTWSTSTEPFFRFEKVGIGTRTRSLCKTVSMGWTPSKSVSERTLPAPYDWPMTCCLLRIQKCHASYLQRKWYTRAYVLYLKHHLMRTYRCKPLACTVLIATSWISALLLKQDRSWSLFVTKKSWTMNPKYSTCTNSLNYFVEFPATATPNCPREYRNTFCTCTPPLYISGSRAYRAIHVHNHQW